MSPSRFTLSNSNNLEVVVSDIGASLIDCRYPDVRGQLGSIVLGFSDLNDYTVNQPYFGATIGRCANRIAHARYQSEGEWVNLDANLAPHHLHGGYQGLSHKLWQAEPFQTKDSQGVRFYILSPDGEAGYPGEVEFWVEYTLYADDRLSYRALARSEHNTPVNLTNHTYWQLAGRPAALNRQQLWLNADSLLDYGANAIPTGHINPVEDSVFDFKTSRTITLPAEGFDHCFVLNEPTGEVRKVAKLSCPDSGRHLTIYSDQPTLQLYSANNLDGSSSSGGFLAQQSICLELQGYPDAVNQANFPAYYLGPEREYRHTTIWQFGLE